ncbi:hypothetical protein EAO76_20340 [Streptomyces sp. sk2.1]|nr:hypothetical protein EAO76_20340 [Streptomyces sp. sk2.1]
MTERFGPGEDGTDGIRSAAHEVSTGRRPSEFDEPPDRAEPSGRLDLQAEFGRLCGAVELLDGKREQIAELTGEPGHRSGVGAVQIVLERGLMALELVRHVLRVPTTQQLRELRKTGAPLPVGLRRCGRWILSGLDALLEPVRKHQQPCLDLRVRQPRIR